MSLDKLPINAFDLVLAAILAFGLVRGRRIGMSGELLSVIKWLAVLFGCAMPSEPLGQLLADTTGIFRLLWCYLIAYVGVGAIILVVFALFKHGLGGTLLARALFCSATL